MYGLVLRAVSSIFWGSWNTFPAEEGWGYFYTRSVSFVAKFFSEWVSIYKYI